MCFFVIADNSRRRRQPFCQKIPKQNKVAYLSEMARNAIESEFRTSKMADGSHFVKNFQNKIKLRIYLKWPEMRSKVMPFCQKFLKKIKLRSDLKWPEMRSKVNFGHPKWAPAAIL